MDVNVKRTRDEAMLSGSSMAESFRKPQAPSMKSALFRIELREDKRGTMGEIEIDNDVKFNGAKEKMVEINLKTIGPLRPSRLKVPSRSKVHDLRKLLAEKERMPIENFSLILRGSVLVDNKIGQDVFVHLRDGDSLIVAVKSKAPANHFRAGDDDGDDEDEDDLKFQLPESKNWWKWRLFLFLRDKLKLPDLILMVISSLSIKAWAVIVLWFILAPITHRWGWGPLYIIGTGFAIIFLNLGKRQEGDVSAYSIFNEDFRELPGTLNAERLDRDIRMGQF
ncbi:hypothetical protein Nepgr_028592 [Nepenthes gracilis]|uniref:Ubiquitin-like domain-containing protein n=1 Tax=Nepenthes gracilis TaxID=150966 RepID=A0AAD3TD59_NEPGR|nr:hypothetical protein Nepgr_028592 [Nepenthes gracilis]